MTRIYYTKSKIHKFDSSSSTLCVKSCSQDNTITHAFWECEKIKKAWMEIQEVNSLTVHPTENGPPEIAYGMARNVFFSGL